MSDHWWAMNECLGCGAARSGDKADQPCPNPDLHEALEIHDMLLERARLIYDSNTTAIYPPELPSWAQSIVAAARRVAEAPEVWWCQVHHSMEATTEQAGVCWLYDGDQDCRMVRKLLVDPPHPQPDQEDE